MARAYQDNAHDVGRRTESFVAEWTLQGSVALPLFSDWIKEVFADGWEYVVGDATPDYMVLDEIESATNNSPAWSWEVRALKTLKLYDYFAPVAIFWEEGDLLTFRDYLTTSIEKPRRDVVTALLASISHRYTGPSLAMQSARKYVATRLNREHFV